jgi:hypothetical protein
MDMQKYRMEPPISGVFVPEVGSFNADEDGLFTLPAVTAVEKALAEMGVTMIPVDDEEPAPTLPGGEGATVIGAEGAGDSLGGSEAGGDTVIGAEGAGDSLAGGETGGDTVTGAEAPASRSTAKSKRAPA